MAVLLFSLSTNHDDRPTCLNAMRCTLSLPPPLYICITLGMLCNIVGQKIDGNYESWKYMGHKTARDRLPPGRGPSFPHRGVRRFFWCCSNYAHIFFHNSYFLKTTVNTLIEDIFLYNMIIMVPPFARTYHIQNVLLP